MKRHVIITTIFIILLLILLTKKSTEQTIINNRRRKTGEKEQKWHEIGTITGETPVWGQKDCWWGIPMKRLAKNIRSFIDTKGEKETCQHFAEDHVKEHKEEPIWHPHDLTINQYIYQWVTPLWKWWQTTIQQTLMYETEENIKTQKEIEKETHLIEWKPRNRLIEKKSTRGVCSTNIVKEKWEELKHAIKIAKEGLKKIGFDETFRHVAIKEEIDLFPTIDDELNPYKKFPNQLKHAIIGVKNIYLTGLDLKRITLNVKEMHKIRQTIQIPITIANLTLTGKLLKYTRFYPSQPITTNFMLKLDNLTNQLIMSMPKGDPEATTINLGLDHQQWKVQHHQLYYTQHHRIPKVVREQILDPIRNFIEQRLTNMIEDTFQKDVLETCAAHFSYEFAKLEMDWIKSIFQSSLSNLEFKLDKSQI